MNDGREPQEFAEVGSDSEPIEPEEYDFEATWVDHPSTHGSAAESGSLRDFEERSSNLDLSLLRIPNTAPQFDTLREQARRLDRTNAKHRDFQRRLTAFHGAFRPWWTQCSSAYSNVHTALSTPDMPATHAMVRQSFGDDKSLQHFCLTVQLMTFSLADNPAEVAAYTSADAQEVGGGWKFMTARNQLRTSSSSSQA